MNQFMLLTTGASAGPTATTGSWISLILYIVFFVVLIYFMMVRPQKKQQKKMNMVLSTIAAGDSVLTTSGFYGVVIDVMDDIVIIEFGNNKNCRIPMKKNAIVEIEKPSTEKTN